MKSIVVGWCEVIIRLGSGGFDWEGDAEGAGTLRSLLQA
jgi:hypothetical protein